MAARHSDKHEQAQAPCCRGPLHVEGLTSHTSRFRPHQCKITAQQDEALRLRQVRANALPKLILRSAGRLHHQVFALADLTAPVEEE